MTIQVRVPFADCRLNSPDVLRRVEGVLRSGRFISGTEVAWFERAWASFCGAGHCVATASGSAALTATFRALFMPGTKIVIPEYSFAATLFSVLEAECQPVFCPVTSNGLMDMYVACEMVNTIQSTLRSGELVGVVPVWLYGQVIELPEYLSDHEQICIVEDACQAHGALEYVQGNAACFSFYPSKNLGAAGDAGAVVCQSEMLATRIYQLCNYGDERGQKYQHSVVGSNQRMDEVQAAVLNVKLPYLSSQNAIRKWQANLYTDAGIESLATAKNNSYHLYPIRTGRHSRAALIAELSKRGVQTQIHYPYALPTLINAGISISVESVADGLAQTVLSLPVGPHLEDDQIKFVIGALTEIAQWLPEVGWVTKKCISEIYYSQPVSVRV